MPATNSTAIAERTLTLEATAHSLDALHQELDRFWQACDAAPLPHPSAVWRLQFATALAEIGGNIIRHAYPNGVGQSFTLRLRLSPRWVEATFFDRGRRYMESPKRPPCGLGDTADIPEGGYGLGIARAALDYLGYRRTGSGVNCWRLRKRFGGVSAS